MWRQVVEVLKPHFTRRAGAVVNPGQFVLCGFSGAALFIANAETGEMEEDIEYRMKGGPKGGNTGISPDHLERATQTARSVLCRFMEVADKDDSLIASLSDKYRKVFPTLLAKRRELGAEEFEKTFYSTEKVTLHGEYLTETNDALLDRQYIPNAPQLAVVQLSVLGIPMARYEEFFTQSVRDEFTAMGMYCKKQPNSVVVAHEGIDKATAVRWIVAHPERYKNFKLSNAWAFGDNPELVDRPLTIFPEMHFVSVSPNAARDPPGLHYVGGEEDGTGLFLDGVMTLSQCPTIGEKEDDGDQKQTGETVELTREFLEVVLESVRNKKSAAASKQKAEEDEAAQ